MPSHSLASDFSNRLAGSHEERPWTAPAYSADDVVDPAGQRTPPCAEGGFVNNGCNLGGSHLADGSNLAAGIGVPGGWPNLQVCPLQPFGLNDGYAVGSNLTDPNGVYGTSPIDPMELRALQVKESGNASPRVNSGATTGSGGRCLRKEPRTK